jgi:hypothetical protein
VAVAVAVAVAGRVTRLADYPGLGGTLVGSSGPFTPGNTWRAVYDVTVSSPSSPIGAPGSAIISRPGPWVIRAGVTSGPAGNLTVEYYLPSTPAVLTVDGVWDDAASNVCGSATSGDFGVLQVPRDMSKLPPGSTASPLNVQDWNLALGLDHPLSAFAEGTLTGAQCPPGGIQDPREGPPVSGANCVYIDSGKKVSFITDGLVTGIKGPGGGVVQRGRLVQDPAAPFVRPTTDPRCVSGNGSSQFTWNAPTNPQVPLVDATLSCYLAPGRTLADVRAGRPGSLRPEILKDPRFFYTIVLNSGTRPPSGASTYYGLLRFDAAFITGEESPEPGCSTLRCNGISFFGGANSVGGRKVKAMSVYVFPATSLPTQVEQAGEGDTFVTGTKDVLLVE